MDSKPTTATYTSIGSRLVAVDSPCPHSNDLVDRYAAKVLRNSATRPVFLTA